MESTYILIDQYWGGSYWGGSYWGVAGVTDIQYTEVFDFIVTSVLVAAFQVETIINTAFTVEMPMLVEMQVYEELSEE